MKKNAHIAIFTTPLSSIVNLLQPIISTLLRRGHRITFPTTDTFGPRVHALGAEVLQYRFERLITKAMDAQSYCRIASHVLAATESFYEKNRPDLIIYDIVAFAGPILARRLNVPLAKVSPYYAFTEEAMDKQMDAWGRVLAVDANSRIDEFLQQHGVSSSGFLFHQEKLNIYLVPRRFDPCPSSELSCLYAGRCAGEQPPFGSWTPPHDRSRRIVLVATSKGHIPSLDYIRNCISALSDLDLHTVLSVDESIDVSNLQPLPPHFEIVREGSHTRILPYASLLIYMGGIGSACEAAYHGVPLVITSLAVPEIEWLGDNYVASGVGIHLRGANVSAAAIRSAALEALDSNTIKGRVRHLQAEVKREAGSEEAANRIEECIDDR